MGSFLGMFTWRVVRGISFSGRSVCDSCKKIIPWYCNIPLLSFLLLKGRCLLCGRKISIRYFLIELVTGLVFVLTSFFLWPYLSLSFLGLVLLLCMVLIALSFIDIEWQILPDLLVATLFLVALLLLFLYPEMFWSLSGLPFWINHLLSGVGSLLFFLALFLITRGRGMGFGDVKLSFVLGFLLGYPSSLLWLFLSFLFGAVSGLCLLALGRARLGQPVAFGPYLLFSAWFTLLFGQLVIEWYIGMI